MEHFLGIKKYAFLYTLELGKLGIKKLSRGNLSSPLLGYSCLSCFHCKCCIESNDAISNRR